MNQCTLSTFRVLCLEDLAAVWIDACVDIEGFLEEDSFASWVKQVEAISSDACQTWSEQETCFPAKSLQFGLVGFSTITLTD